MDDKEQHIRGILGGRQVYWCPDGNGYPPYCPRPTDDNQYTYCCTYGYEISIPTCCRFPIHTGLVYALILSAFVFVAVIVFLWCWCWPWCPLALRVRQVSQERKKCEVYGIHNNYES